MGLGYDIYMEKQLAQEIFDLLADSDLELQEYQMAQGGREFMLTEQGMKIVRARNYILSALSKVSKLEEMVKLSEIVKGE